MSKKQKFYQNVTNPPLLTGDAGQLVLQILGVPELHLLIGIGVIKDQNLEILELFDYSSPSTIVTLRISLTLVQSGIVDKLLTEFERKVLETRKAGLTFVDKF